MFFNNFGQNRDDGVMAFGQLFENRLNYAVGGFNGTRNGFLATKDAKAVSGLVNFKPFVNRPDTLLENFNIGGSILAVNMDNPPVPQIFRTMVPTAGNPVIGVPFLELNADVRESGLAALYDLHAAWFYKQLALIAEWGTGTQRYAHVANLSDRVGVPVQSFYVQSGYMLTGETRSQLGITRPIRPFNLKPDKFGLGAWELTGRYNYLQMGDQVFTGGLADPNLWARNLYTTDVGLNWHLTQYIKMYFDWEHAVFGQPVEFAPGRRQLTSDAFVWRFQIYF